MPDLRCVGGGRDAENRQTLFFCFNRRPTDDELRFIHDVVQRSAFLVDDDSKTFLRLVPKDSL